MTLFCLYKSVEYRQGMHELLAVVAWTMKQSNFSLPHQIFQVYDVFMKRLIVYYTVRID